MQPQDALRACHDESLHKLRLRMESLAAAAAREGLSPPARRQVAELIQEQLGDQVCERLRARVFVRVAGVLTRACTASCLLVDLSTVAVAVYPRTPPRTQHPQLQVKLHVADLATKLAAADGKLQRLGGQQAAAAREAAVTAQLLER